MDTAMERRKSDQSTTARPEIQELASGPQVLSIIECPICFNVPFPPIFNCKTGHTICSTCKEQLNACPLCKGEFSNGRNFVVESIVLSSKHSCKYKENGCKTILKGDEMMEHLNNCRFKGISCNCHLGCWTGCVFKESPLPLSAYLDHLKEGHMLLPSVTRAPNIIFDSTVLTHVSDTFWRGDYTVVDGNVFVVRQFVRNSLVYFSMAIVANESTARKYVVDVKITSAVDKEVKMCWTLPVHSVQLKEDEIRDEFCGCTTLSWIKTHSKISPVNVSNNNGVNGRKKMKFSVEYLIRGRTKDSSQLNKTASKEESEIRLRQHGFVL